MKRVSPGSRAAAAWAFVLAAVGVCGALSGLTGCKRKHVPVDAVPELPYPTCDGDAAPSEAAASARIARRTMRGASDSMSESRAIEAFELRPRGCHVVATVRQEWQNGTADVEVIFDDALRPLRAWKRMIAPDPKRAGGHVDVRRYELRTPEVTLAKRSGEGPVVYEVLRGARPTAVIGPGRGLLTAWIRRANLAVGEKVREPVLDFREIVEILRDVTLKREPDLFEPTLQRNVRVYTIYGREAVFTDEENVVLGDLAGMRPIDGAEASRAADASPWSAVAPDPVHTP